MSLIDQSEAWKKLAAHKQTLEKVHLRDLLNDATRCQSLYRESDGIALDYSRQRVNTETMKLLYELAEAAKVKEMVQSMANGDHVNTSENRAVMHIALRANDGDKYNVDGVNVVPEVRGVIAKINSFAAKVRSGEWRGATGKPLTNVIAIGIGGSYLGANFVYEALRCEPSAQEAAQGRQLSFLANVDPVGFTRAVEGFDPETTLAIIISKTFTTRETMLNARTVKQWFIRSLGEASIAKHMVACSTNLEAVSKFGIDPENAFAFWDWVGGRYSVTSAVGLVPLTLHFGEQQVSRFLAGARSIDRHFIETPYDQNLPMILGLLGIWNRNFWNHASRALACYSESLLKFAPHIQQVDMESNGKRVTKDGKTVTYATGPINFGEPGTNAQHSFFQLFHQGEVVPVDFIGFANSQTPIHEAGEEVSNHDELMANFFAQPDALATGKTAEQLQSEGVAADLIAHRLFPGNRPSSVMLLQDLTAYEVGQLLALYEHRTVVEGAIWGIDSFDQWGVELGKILANKVRSQFVESRKSSQAEVKGFNPSTTHLLQKYLSAKQTASSSVSSKL